MNDALLRTITTMGTVVTVHVVGHGATECEQLDREAAVERALAWFRQINDDCTRFDPTSELSRLSCKIGTPVSVSPLLFEALRFALAVAEETGGAFDPTVGLRMETRGFHGDYRHDPRPTTHDAVPTTLFPRRFTHDASPTTPHPRPTYRDVQLDETHQTITLRAPLLLDLGAVAKGLAIDMAARELEPFENFAIDAGGDLYLAGCNAEGNPWSVGIRHPREKEQLLGTLHLTDIAVCTSGDYERPSPNAAGEHHIMDPRTDASANRVASVTVLARSAMVADALGTAAFVLGPSDGIRLLERHGVEGLIVTPALERIATAGMPDLAPPFIPSSLPPFPPFSLSPFSPSLFLR